MLIQLNRNGPNFKEYENNIVNFKFAPGLAG